MATIPVPDETANKPRPKTWESLAVQIAFHIASPNFDRGDLAALKRMDPNREIAPIVWRLMAQWNIETRSVETERKWALIMHGMALVTRTNGDSVAVRVAHDGATPVGRALFLGGNPDPKNAYYSPSRFSRLMTARGIMFRALLSRMFRMMASAGQPFNWYQMAQLILAEDYDEDRAERMRRIIARDYYWAEDRARRRSV